VRSVARRGARLATFAWPPHSRLFLVGEQARWSVDHDLAVLARIAGELGARIARPQLVRASRDQAAFYGSHFTLLTGPWDLPPHRLGCAYFHGRPGTPGMPEFDEAYAALRRVHGRIDRIQVTHGEMEELVLSAGIDAAKVHRIPIGIDPGLFTPQTPELRTEAREALGIPRDAFVVGSFHKDGVGWDEGAEPKLIKGPDTLVAALRALDVPEKHVLLSAPARGYVQAGLRAAGIPFTHRVLDHYPEIGSLYAALDAYVVPSRQEGGPKGVLEALAAGVPLVTTRVGQAADIVRHGENGWLVEPEDAEGLAHWLGHVASNPEELPQVIAAGLETARANSYEAQLPLWKGFLEGFVRLG